MYTIYVYVLDTLADWEMGHVISELNSGRFFKKDSQRVVLTTVSDSKEPIKTMGGLTVVPDCVIDDIVVSETSVLLLPGADTWNTQKHRAIIKKAEELLDVGATAALADHGLLDQRRHTSNGPGFLEMLSPGYQGQSLYADKPSVTDGGLITAGSTGALLWAKQIIERLGVFEPDTLEAWYEYFSTGKPEHFFALMQTLPVGKDN